MIRSLHRARDGTLRTDLDPSQYAAALQDERGLLWIDLQGEPAAVCEPILRDTFGFHPLAVEDALEETHVPKLDDWGDYLYLVLRAVACEQTDEECVGTTEVDLFLGANFLVTYRSAPVASVDRVWTVTQQNERHVQRGTSHLLYRLADEMAADFMPVIEEIDDAIDRIEDQVFDDPQPELLEQIFTLKRSLLHLRRVMAPQREVLNKLARGEYAVIHPESRVFFRDVYDHLVRLHDVAESLRDLVGSALETYLTVVSNRMNEVMKVLTIIATIFIPLTFIAGVYGMNFEHMPELGWPWAYPAVWFAMGIVAVLMIIYFKRKDWL
jgi:magnesium transporter